MALDFLFSSVSVVVSDAGDTAAEEAVVAAMDYIELSTGTNIHKSMLVLDGLKAKTDVEKGNLERKIYIFVLYCVFVSLQPVGLLDRCRKPSRSCSGSDQGRNLQ